MLKRAVNYFKHLNFNKKLIISYFLLILFPVVSISVVSVNVTKYILVQEISKSNIEALSQISKNINLLLTNVVERLNTVYLNQEVIRILEKNKDKSKEDMDSMITYGFNEINDYQTMSSILSEFSYSFSSLKTLTAAITPKGLAFTSWNSDENNFSDFIIYSNSYFKDQENEILWLGSNNPALSKNQGLPMKGKTFTAVRYVSSPYNNVHIGYLLISINEEKLYETYKDFIKRNENSQVFVVDKEGNMVSGDWNQGISALKGIIGKIEKVEGDRQQGYFTDKVNGSQYIISYNVIEKTGWIIIHVVPLNTLLSKTNILYFAVLIVIILSFTTAFIMSILFSRRMSGKLMKLRDAMMKADTDELLTKVDITSNDEIGDLSKSFNLMVDRIRDFMQQLILEQEKKREAEMDFLQAQINSHFLYNTLNSIKVLVRLNRINAINGLVTSLIKLLRATTSKSSDSISVQQEIENVKHYVFIQKIRYMDKFEVSYDYPEEILQNSIPRLLLQPIVENAIFHGIQDKIGKGLIEIKAFSVDDNLCFLIKDNGKGIEDSVLQDIFNKNKLNKVGLKNVDDRIKLHYGQNYGIKVESELGEGTEVSIFIPRLN